MGIYVQTTAKTDDAAALKSAFGYWQRTYK